MSYQYKYPELYAELARQNKSQKDLANALGITRDTLRKRQDIDSMTDFRVYEMKAAAAYLGRPVAVLFGL